MEASPFATPIGRARRRGRRSFAARRQRFRDKRWQIAQCAVAAGVAWFLAKDVLGHDVPVFAPIAAVVSLGTSYAQRLRRVVEVTAGVAIGVFLGDLLVAGLGSGAWQIALVVGLSMTAAVMLDAGTLFINQAAIQGLFVAALVPGTGASLTRWTDALVGGAVALVAATVVPAAPLRRPREQAAAVLDKVAELLRGSASVLVDGDAERALLLLADARSTDHLVRRLEAAADEGMAVATSSPFRVRHRPGIRKMADLVDPLDRALRSTRVLVRQVTVAAYHDIAVPHSYAVLADELAAAVDTCVAELRANRQATAARPALLAVGAGSGAVERSEEMTAEVVLAQIRSVVADLLMLTGMEQLEATDALPPPPR
ncbi:FUSC family protein [Nocardioides dongxiaopingii]|uniref:FUSC family protein n=1 Tax=Nocardioides dongxiaopingii TaxID=2576036 RepID=UPI0010C77146|nr:FUSC family protein [Nocardioides dongxiaopingii]